MFTMKNEVVGRPIVVSDDFVQSVDRTTCDKLPCEFQQISRTDHYGVINS
jgi:hypothetical protein